MQIVISFVVMGLIAVSAVALIAAAALIRLLPLLVVVLVVVGAVRCWERRHSRPAPGRPRPVISRPAPPLPPTLPRPDGWVMVPVWLNRSGRPQRRPIIDAEVISVDEHHG